MGKLVEQRGLSRYFEVFCETVYYAGKFFNCFEITDKTFLQQYSPNNKTSKANLWTVFIQNVNNRKSIEEASSLKDLVNSFIIPDKEKFLPKYDPFLKFFNVTPYKNRENSKTKYVYIDAIIKAINDKLFSTSQVRNNDFISYEIKKYYGSSNTNSSWGLYSISNYLVEPFQIVEFNFPEIYDENFIQKNSIKEEKIDRRQSKEDGEKVLSILKKNMSRELEPSELIKLLDWSYKDKNKLTKVIGDLRKDGYEIQKIKYRLLPPEK